MTTATITASRPATPPAGRQNTSGPRQAWTATPGTSTRKQRFLTVHKPYGDETIGPLLTRLRKARGYSQLTVAQMLCATSGHPTVSRHEVSRWERQERIPSEFWLRPLADVLAIPIDVLRGGVAATRGRHLQEPGEHHEPGAPLVNCWLTLHHGPTEIMIALGGVEVDQLRTVLAPVTASDPSIATAPVEATE